MENVRHELNQPVNLEVFKKVIRVQAVRASSKEISKSMELLKPILLGRKGKRNVYPDAQPEVTPNAFKLIALNEELTADQARKKSEELAPGKEFEFVTTEVELDYSDFNYYEALRVLLPAEVTTPTGFETIGHIAHLNLRENQFPWKYLIGQVIREKTKEISTVVNKMDKLHNEFRTPELELISGEKIYETKVHEEGTTLYLDVEKVYWCSRLHAERSRVLSSVKQTDVICDAFCGVGPFAVRAAKEKGCKVFASDLNPHCTEYLVKNIGKNKVAHLVEPKNEDARKYIREMLGREFKGEVPHITRWFMNLPGDAVEFLDAFTGYFRENPGQIEKLQPSSVHVYCFLQKETEALMREKLVERVQVVMPNFGDSDICNIHTLKSVSSEKDMCCLTFNLHSGNVDPTDPTKGEKKMKVE